MLLSNEKVKVVKIKAINAVYNKLYGIILKKYNNVKNQIHQQNIKYCFNIYINELDRKNK